MKKVSIFLVSLLLMMAQTFLAFSAFAANANTDKETKAVQAAEAWLKLVDAKNYKESWEQASAYMKEKITSREWEKSVASVRSQFGALVSRKLKAKVYTTSVPGAPPGEYVVIEFNTQFQNRKTAIETVTPALELNGWKVSGYFVR